MEYVHLLPWGRSSKENEDDETEFNEDNSLSECETRCHVNNSRCSVLSLNEGDVRFLGLAHENGEIKSARFTGKSVNERLMMAIEANDPELVERCLNNGADPNHQYTSNRITALHLAGTVGSAEIVRILLKKGANILIRDSGGVTPLHLAAGNGLIELVQDLIAAGADVTAQDFIGESGTGGESPLHKAALGGHHEIICKLISSGAKVDITDAKGRTPLHQAAQSGSTGCIQALLDFKADPNVLDKQGISALLLLGGGFIMKEHCRASGYNESVKVLINRGADVHVKDPHLGVTPLHQAVMLGQLEATRLFLINGCRLNSPDYEGNTALHVCASKGHVAILKLLLAQPAALEGIHLADSKGRLPLHKAAYRGSMDCIQLLLKAGTDLGSKTNMGISATALILQHPNGVKMLGQRLDASIGSNGIDPSENACRIRFDYSVLLTKNKIQQMGVVEDILNDRKERRTADLLQHPLIESFLFLKWRKIRFLFLSNLIFYFILMTGVTAYVLATVSSDNKTPLPDDNRNSTIDVRFKAEPATVLRLQLSLNVIILIIIFQEIVQFASLHVQYFRETESWIKLGALVTSTIVIFSTPPWPKWVHHISAVAVLLGWSEVTLLLGRLPTFGVYALMFFSVAQHLFKFILVFFFFLAGFSFSFFLLFTDKLNAFNSPRTSLLRTFAMMLGDASYDEYFTEDQNNLSGTAHVIYFCFLVLVSLILMNLLIGLAVNDIEGLQNEGRVKRLRKQAKFIVYLEDVASNRLFNWMSYRFGVRHRFHFWINLDAVFVFNPASRKEILPLFITDHAIAILQQGRTSPTQSIHLFHGCMASIQELRKRMEHIERELIGTPSIRLPTTKFSKTMAIVDNLGNSNDTEVIVNSIPSHHSGEDYLFKSSSKNAISGDSRMESVPVTNTRMVEDVSSSIRSDLQDIKAKLCTLSYKSNPVK